MLIVPAALPLVLAAALVCWPPANTNRRLYSIRHGHVHNGVPACLTNGARYALFPSIAIAGAMSAGLGGLCAATAVALVGTKYRRSRAAARNRLDQASAFARGIRLLVAELRAGAHPATAAEGAAVDGPPAVSALFRELASSARLNADVATVLSGRCTAELRAPVGRLVRAWALAQRRGVALADLLDAVCRDVEQRAAFLRTTEAKMAGPRATAVVLSVLPILGVALGEAVGAAPLEVLRHGLLGQCVLVVGAGLLCAGWQWSMRLTEVVARP